MSLDEDWELFDSEGCESFVQRDIANDNETPLVESQNIPDSTKLYISTKTKIAYLSSHIDLYPLFWKIHVMPYTTFDEGVIKKQMKFNSASQEELEKLMTEYETESVHKKMFVIHNSDIQQGQQKHFKDVRKINIGLCKKDILSQRAKEKSAFYNCFVLILRIRYGDIYREIHVKVFNTGKLEIPGIQDDEMFHITLKKLIDVLHTTDNTLRSVTVSNNYETVLINSNFHCGYYINRDKLYRLLVNKYRIHANYDPCSYPGIQCKYKYDDGKELSFMIFRTGSVLIVGKCEMEQLLVVYSFLTKLLVDEYNEIVNVTQEKIPEPTQSVHSRPTKIRKKIHKIDPKKLVMIEVPARIKATL
jgi:TATA-box binding protein (TBP) (component of TFIID and TFIIIB)